MTRLISVAACLALLGCEGPVGPEGPPGPEGPTGTGTRGDPGQNGTNGQDGQDGRSPWLVGPGLTFQITNASIDGSGVARVTFRVTDADGTPLDIDGLLTEGPVSARFILAWLDQNTSGEPLQYTAYTTRDQTSPITSDTATQASTDSGGTFTPVDLDDGVFSYTFGTTVNPADGTRTHTVGVYATRNFEGERYVANATFDFRPDGNAVTVTRDVVKTESCNGCHNPLALHGGSRRSVKLCIMCHQPQSVDPDTGNTVDFKVMVHKIHRGADLPSVVAGGEYQIIGYNQSTHDYSTVEFPQDVRNCQTCHTGAQGDLWKTRPSRTACASCHDNISFTLPVPAGMVLHPGGEQLTDDNCTVCHPASGSIAGLQEKHYTAQQDPANGTLALAIDSVTNTEPGQAPIVSFTVTVDGVGRDILSSPLSSLRATVAGPTTDYVDYWQVRIQGSGASGTLSAIDAANGKFQYIFPNGSEIPATATGSYALGLEGYFQAADRVAAINPVAYFAVTDTTAVARRQVVDRDSCNSCHSSLGAHGGGRTDPKYCVMCHNPRNTNDERVSRFEDTTVTAKPVDFKVMIHAIHRGEGHVNDYFLGAYPTPSVTNPAGSQHNFAELRFPGDLRSCGTCHTGSSFLLPLKPNVLASRAEILTCTEDPAADGDDYCNTRSSTDVFIPPTTAVCTSCHDADYTKAHAETMTSMSGAEACATCHGPGSLYDMAHYHKLDP